MEAGGEMGYDDHALIAGVIEKVRSLEAACRNAAERTPDRYIRAVLIRQADTHAGQLRELEALEFDRAARDSVCRQITELFEG